MSQPPGHRRFFLTDVPLDEATQRFFGTLEEAGALLLMADEEVPLAQAQGRITARPVWATVSSPHYDAAAMDGAAVWSADTIRATETSPVRLTIGSEAEWVDTGDPMPPEYDAVIMIEHLHRVDDGAAVEAMAPVAPWQHVRPMGEDIVATEMVLPESHRLGPVDLGACAASGATELVVRQQPRVAIIPTGKELVPIGSAGLKPGDIVEFNSLMLAGLIHDWGGRSKTLPPVTDDPALIQDAVLWALEDHDLIIVNAGSSAGSEDFTAQVVE